MSATFRSSAHDEVWRRPPVPPVVVDDAELVTLNWCRELLGHLWPGAFGTAALARTARAPVFLRRLVPRVVDAVADRTADTAVLSNLGRVEDPPWFGGAGKGLWFSPPPRSPVVLTVGAATTGEHLGISLRWCRSALTAAAAGEFAKTLRASLGALRAAVAAL